MFPADLYASERTALVRDRTERDLLHRQLVHAARSTDHVPAARSGVVNRIRVRVGEALVASGTAIAGPQDDHTTTGAINRPA